MTLRERLDTIRERIEMLGSGVKANLCLGRTYPLEVLHQMARDFGGRVTLWVQDVGGQPFAMEEMSVSIGPLHVTAMTPEREPTLEELARLEQKTPYVGGRCVFTEVA